MNGVSPSWLVPGHVIFVEFQGDCSTEAMHALDAWLKTALDSVRTSQVCLLGDMRQMGERWPPLLDLLQFKSVYHPRVGHVVTINASRDRILRFCIRTILRPPERPYHDFETLEQAVAYLKQLDATLSFPSSPTSGQPS